MKLELAPDAWIARIENFLSIEMCTVLIMHVLQEALPQNVVVLTNL
jgi:hypothetical protein